MNIEIIVTDEREETTGNFISGFKRSLERMNKKKRSNRGGGIMKARLESCSKCGVVRDSNTGHGKCQVCGDSFHDPIEL